MRVMILALALIAASGTTASAQFRSKNFTRIPDYDPKIHPYPARNHASCVLKANRLAPFLNRQAGAAPLTAAEQTKAQLMRGDLDRSCNGYRAR